MYQFLIASNRKNLYFQGAVSSFPEVKIIFMWCSMCFFKQSNQILFYKNVIFWLSPSQLSENKNKERTRIDTLIFTLFLLYAIYTA